MGDIFPYLDGKEVYDLVLHDSQEWVILQQKLPAEKLSKLKKRYRHVHTVMELLETGKLFSLLASGTSLLRKEDHAKNIGMIPSVLVTYSLGNLTHVQKTRFGYALRGRKPGEGLINTYGARMVGRNALLIPEKKITDLEAFLASWSVDSTKQRVFIPSNPQEVDNQQGRGIP